MFGLGVSRGSGPIAILAALHRSLAIIEFDPTGRILGANENFCRLMGYDLAEIKGQHHRIFVEPDQVLKPDYQSFWDKLARGEHDAREYKRIAKGGGKVWIQASYNPIKNAAGKVCKVVKVAADITADKLKNIEFESKITAISRVSAVIEFTPDGEIITANENFLRTMGYRLDETKGLHHRMFVDPDEARSDDYLAMWRKLNDGEFVTTEFKRFGKDKKEVWIQASYNPVFDLDGKVVKIVKFATDVTDRVYALNEIGAGLTRLADGDLEHRLDKAFVPNLEKLRRDFNVSVDNLQSSMTQISDSTRAIQSGTQEISSASDDLSRRTEQQAASLEETAAALDEITATVNKTAEGALQAREGVAKADEQAKRSAVVVRQAVEAMDAIASSARQITQIIGVIDEIAFQTNLLALNAGVEAARAGDAGRGFAVVASEVRALAQRSAEAAKEIKALISTSTTQVDNGVKLVAETGRSLQLIMTQVGSVNTVVGEIAVGAREQATALQDVNTAINQMDQTTQQNAAMVEESTAASRSMSLEVDQLSAMVGRFKTGPGAPGEQALRLELQKAAPHAFRKAAPTRGAIAPSSAHPAVKAVVNGAPPPDWQEF